MPPIIKRASFVAFFSVCVLFTGAQAASAQSAPEYRAVWVETFNTPLGTRAEIDRVIASAEAGRINAIFAQVRRRGDSWYLDTLEPLTQVANVGEPDSSGGWTLDPLKYLIEQAHTRGIEVHAFVIIGTVYNAHPTITGLPRDPKHAFNQNFWDRSTSALYPTSDLRQWSTRALPHNATGTTFDGQRFGAEWYIDFGHPAASAYTVDVLTHLVRQYDLDGIHLDRIRYPEAPIDQPAGGIAAWGINVGYNETSVNRFRTRYGSAATYYTTEDIGKNVSSDAAPRRIGSGDVGYPRTGDSLWNDWRREQVTNFARRLYLNVTAVKPRIKVSAATIAFWTGPVGSGGWERTEAHYRVFQDWRSWVQEGILDLATPMIYKREHSALERTQYDDWLSFTKTLAASSGRQSVAGLGAYLNGVEGTLRQARRALARAPFETGNTAADGVIFYALGSTAGTTVGNSTSAAVTTNPFSYPTAGLNTPKRTNDDFFAGLTTSAARSDSTLFEDPADPSLFATTVPPPDMPWKTAPTLGHVMGFALDADGQPLDGAFVTLVPRSVSAASRSARADGGGFYGVVGIAPGAYTGRIVHGTTQLAVCEFAVTPGHVATASARPDASAPVTMATIDPSAPAGAGGWYLDTVRIALDAADDCSGVSDTEYSLDGGATWQPYTGGFAVAQEGTTVVQYRSTDAAGNTEAAQSLTVRIDKTDPTVSAVADPRELRRPNGAMVPVTVRGSAADPVSGLSSVTYQIVDEYGMPFAIAPRALSGASAAWTDSVALEARRQGADRDGRLYRIVVTVRDESGRTSTTTIHVIAMHDQR